MTSKVQCPSCKQPYAEPFGNSYSCNFCGNIFTLEQKALPAAVAQAGEVDTQAIVNAALKKARAEGAITILDRMMRYTEDRMGYIRSAIDKYAKQLGVTPAQLEEWRKLEGRFQEMSIYLDALKAAKKNIERDGLRE